MKKAIGFILAFILTIGIAFGAQQVISSRDAAPKPTTSKQVTSSSSSSTSSSHLKQPSHQQKAKGASKAKPKADRRAQKTANKPQTASSQSSTSPNRTTGSSAKASPNKVAKTKRSNAPKSDKLGKINHKAETKVFQDTHHAAKKSSNAKNTIQIHLTIDGYKKFSIRSGCALKRAPTRFQF